MSLAMLPPLAQASAGAVDVGHGEEALWGNPVWRPRLSVGRIYVPNLSRGKKTDRRITEKERKSLYCATH